MIRKFQGGCSCCTIRYECDAEPVYSFNCHCKECQKFTGSAFQSAFLVPANGFKLLSGKPTFYTLDADSGEQISRGFCAKCGSPVCAKYSGMPDVVGIPAGSLDDPSWFKPAMDIYTAMAQPWHVMNPGLKKFPGSPRKQ